MTVAIANSYGYDGDIDEPEWADLLPKIGGWQYGVAGAGDWRVTAGGSGDRPVRVAAGKGWGHGVLDVNDGFVTLNHASVSSGRRYDCVVARRIWATNTTVFDIVEGSSAYAIPTLLSTPGVEDEQPLALVAIDAGEANVTFARDLRVAVGDGGAQAFHPFALSYMTRVGTKLTIDGVEHQRLVDAVFNPYWSSIPHTTSYTNIAHIATFQNAGAYPFGFLPQAGGAMLRGAVQKISGSIGANAKVAQLPEGARPGATVRVAVWSSTAGQMAKLRFDPDGAVYLITLVGGGVDPTYLHFDGVFIPR